MLCKTATKATPSIEDANGGNAQAKMSGTTNSLKESPPPSKAVIAAFHSGVGDYL